jgi:hypothetical protein
VLDGIRHLDRSPHSVCEVTHAAEAAWDNQIQSAMAGTVWTSGGCASWYLDAHGRNTTLWPGSTVTFRHHTRRFDPAAYTFSTPVRAAAVA